MHILIEHILTGSTNRPLYESLWNLSISKTVKPNQQFLNENQSISTICNQIIQEIKRDDPDRSNFYYSTQIAFGCVILYRHQIDKLYNQTRNALQSCTATFFEINWLSQMAQRVPKKEKQKAGAGKKKQNEPNKKNKGKQAQPEVVNLGDDFDLLEDVFKMGDSPVAQPKKAGKEFKQPLQELDPTMAISANQITILEAKPTDYVRTFNMKQDIAEDDFDEDFGAGDKQFDFSFHFSVLQQTGGGKNIESQLPMSLNDSPDELRCANASNRDLPLTLPLSGLRNDDFTDQENDSRKKRGYVKRPFPQDEEPSTFQGGNYSEMPLTLQEDSLCGDIMNIVSKQMKSRKRRASVDLSTRVEASKGSRLEEPEPLEADPNYNIDFSIGNIGEPLVPIASSTPNKKFAKNNDVQAENNFVDSSPISPITKAPMKRAQKRKLCVDKDMKLPIDSLTQRTTFYKQHFMLPLPLSSFEATFFRIKVSNEPYLTSPSSCLKHGAEQLLSIFKRNLMRIPNSLKRKLPQDNQLAEADPPVKKPRASKKAVVKETTLDPIEIPVTLDPLEVPPFEELAPVIPELELPEIEVAEEQEVALPSKKAQQVAVPKFAKKASGATFKESEKWSKAKIMKTLGSLWKQKVTSVTMITLCPNSNRFVAAGVFFELMELSKLGAVELVQGEGLQLVDVKPGSNAKAFK